MKNVLSTAYAFIAYVAFLGSFAALVLASTGLLPAFVPAVDGPPMMLGILIGIWAAPHLTLGHVVFGASLTAYIILGVHFEERSLLRELGENYARYRAEVPMLLPWPRPSGLSRRAGLA
jgi:protein-S-isoprenylcysteine O-methyltransferase Ste14